MIISYLKCHIANIIFVYVGLFLLLFKHSCPKVRSVMGCTYKQPRTDLNLEHK